MYDLDGFIIPRQKPSSSPAHSSAPKKEEEDNKPAKRVKHEHNAVRPPSPSSSGKRLMSAAPLADHPIAERYLLVTGLPISSRPFVSHQE